MGLNMVPMIAQMHDALLAAELVLSDLDAMLRKRHPTLPTLPELAQVRQVLARFIGEDE